MESVEQSFRQDLSELLKKYDAELYIERGEYPEFQLPTISVFIPSVFDGNECVRNGVDFDLGEYVSAF